MDQKPTKPRDLAITVNACFGSSVQAVTVSGKRLFKRAGLRYSDHVISLHADWSQNPPESLSAAVDEQIGNDEFFRLAYPKSQQMLSEMDEQGMAWNMPPDWHRNLGAAGDGMGAGGDPNHGRMMAKVNHDDLLKKIQDLIQRACDYQLGKKIVSQGNRPEENVRVPMHIFLTAVGAMGTGSGYWLLSEGLSSCVRQTGIEIKVVPHLLLSGSLAPQDAKVARLNEFINLKQTQVWASGGHQDPFGDRYTAIPFSYCELTSNLNEHGNLTSLAQLLHHSAHAQFFKWATPAGHMMRERACDIEGIAYNDYGDPLCGQTFSVALLTRDSDRVIRFCTLTAARMFCRRLIETPPDQSYVDEAIALARNERLLETKDDNLLTSDIIRPEELGRESVIRQCHESIRSRVAGSHGWQRALQWDAALADALNHDIPSYYEPAMQKQAQLRLRTVSETITTHLEQSLRTAADLARAQRELEALRQIVNESLDVLRQDKIPEIEAFLVPHQMVLAEASEQIGRIQQANFLTRWLSVPLIRRIAAELQESGLAAIGHQLELSCCRIADTDLLTGLLEFLDGRIGWLASGQRKIENIAETCAAQLNSLITADTTPDNPNGYELTTPPYLAQFFQGYLANHGGPASFIEQLRRLFMETHGSMEVCLETPQAQLQDMLGQLIGPVFEPVVNSTTVWQEFEKTHPNVHIRQEMISQLIRHSAGRVIAEDSAGESVTWVKTANVPDASLVEPVRQMLEALDRKGGKWEVAVHDDIDTVSLGQLRGAISLSPFLRRLAIPDNEVGWRALAGQAIDVISVLIIPPRPNLRQFRRVLAKAVAADLITVQKGEFCLRRPQGQPLALGQDFESVKNVLIKKWRELVFIESAYGRALMLEEKQILDRLETIGNNSDPCRTLFDEKALAECRCQSQIMLPRLRRMRVAALREETL